MSSYPFKYGFIVRLLMIINDLILKKINTQNINLTGKNLFFIDRTIKIDFM